ncbi:MAG: hypothetical protein ABIF87_13960 [Pseudomonadota bacterium]
MKGSKSFGGLFERNFISRLLTFILFLTNSIVKMPARGRQFLTGVVMLGVATFVFVGGVCGGEVFDYSRLTATYANDEYNHGIELKYCAGAYCRPPWSGEGWIIVPRYDGMRDPAIYCQYVCIRSLYPHEQTALDYDGDGVPDSEDYNPYYRDVSTPPDDGDDQQEESDKTLGPQTDTRSEITGGDPFNLATGNVFTYPIHALVVKGRTLAIDLYHTYNSQSEYNGSFGYG